MDDNTQQVTSKTPTTSPQKEPKKVAAGKALAKKTKQACEEQEKAPLKRAPPHGLIFENKKDVHIMSDNKLCKVHCCHGRQHHSEKYLEDLKILPTLI